jgi:hypothetical protein
MNEHDLIQEDLPAYAASRLEEPALGRLEAHLKFCGECREMAARFRSLASFMRADGDALFEPHPTEAALLRHVAGGAVGDRDGIARHLEVCATCSLEAGVWREQRQQARAFPQAVPSRRSSGWKIAATLAAGLILGAGLSLPISRAIRTAGLPPATPALPTTAGPATPGPEPSVGPQLILPRILRGETPVISYAPAPNQTFVVIACLATIAPEAPPESAFRYEIRRSTGGSVWSRELTAAEIRRHLESTEVVTLLVPGTTLPPGRYEFRLAPSLEPERVLYAAELKIAGP